MTHYNGTAPLVKYIAKHDGGPVDLYGRFKLLDKHLVDKVHNVVGQGAALKGIWLTDHGPKHIKTVIRRIGDLTFQKERFVIDPYEAYLLAVAAHFHDIGNIYGREGHETKARDELFSLDESLIGPDTIEKRRICDIARAHGGRVGDSKDTIGKLPDDRGIRKLAAILRFADELAEDYTRTSTIDTKVLQQDEKAKMKSEIYHLYAERLAEIKVDHDARRVSLSFELQPCHLIDRYYKDGEQRYLLEEIYERTLKVHREQVYCSRFMMPDIVSERVEVEINVCGPKYAQILGRFRYTLEQKGYPDHIGEFDGSVAACGMSNLRGATVAARIGDVVAHVGHDSPPLDLNDAFRIDNVCP